jgi:hypothetical protein
VPSDNGEIVLGVDLDGVCADFYARMREIAAEWLEVGLELRGWGWVGGGERVKTIQRSHEGPRIAGSLVMSRCCCGLARPGQGCPGPESLLPSSESGGEAI